MLLVMVMLKFRFMCVMLVFDLLDISLKWYVLLWMMVFSVISVLNWFDLVIFCRVSGIFSVFGMVISSIFLLVMLSCLSLVM